MENLKNCEKGFTLIEIMIVVAIVAILASVAIPAYFNHLSRSRQKNAINELMQIRASQEMYFAENGEFADSMGYLHFYESVGTAVGVYYYEGYYKYKIEGNNIKAEGDLNKDGNYTDKWVLPIDDLSAKPLHDNSSDEGIGWSSLAALFQ